MILQKEIGTIAIKKVCFIIPHRLQAKFQKNGVISKMTTLY